MEHVTRTLRLSALQSSMIRLAPYKWVPFTTLNEKFNIQSKVYPAAATYPGLSAVAIGRGGIAMDAAEDGSLYPEILQHKSTDAALFEHMPFALRQLDNDLPSSRRGRYALRNQVTYHGVPYWAYWLKWVDFTQADTEMFLKQKNGENITVTSYKYDTSNLNPTPSRMSDAGANLLAGQSVVASTLIAMTLDDFDIQEIRDASRIITRKSSRATISEMALCTAAKKSISAPGTNGSFTFTEAIGVEIATHVKAMYALDYINKSFSDNLELGISEPMFQIEGVNQ